MTPKSKLKIVAATLALAALQACTSTSAQKDASANLTFPDVKDAYPKDGTFPNLDNLRMLAPGMTKAQHYELISHPNFPVAWAGVREWDYLFNLRTNQPAPNNVVECQMKVLFDKDMLSSSYHWSPAACADLLKKPVVAAPAPASVSPQTVVNKATTLSGDALFRFGGSSANDLHPKGRSQLEAMGQELAAAKGARSIVVAAYTDRLGSASHNQALSQRRAETVRSLFIAKGVDGRIIAAEGRGSANPVSQCGSMPKANLIDCLAPDRRVEIRASVAN